MLLTVEPQLLESLQQTLNSLPPGSTYELAFELYPFEEDIRDIRNPPSDEALLATATQLARAMSSSETLRIFHASAALTATIFAACSRVQSLFLGHYKLTAANVQMMFSIKTLRQLTLVGDVFLGAESVDAFCLGMRNSSLEIMTLYSFSLSPEQEAQVAMVLARSKTLEKFYYFTGASRSFCDHYCETLSNNFDTKLELLRLDQVSLHGDRGEGSGLDTAIEAKIRNLLKLNVQRKTCPPLFAAIGNAETDAKRKQCLVEAFDAVDIPVVFEYITANENNMMSLIQRLGRSCKRQREG